VTLQILSVSLISSLLNEFSSDKASAVGLPLEFHLYCRKSFQDEQLLSLFTLILNIMHPITTSISKKSDLETRLLGLCFAALEKILSWDFATDGTFFLA
jgi:hypothetical protein